MSNPVSLELPPLRAPPDSSGRALVLFAAFTDSVHESGIWRGSALRSAAMGLNKTKRQRGAKNFFGLTCVVALVACIGGAACGGSPPPEATGPAAERGSGRPAELEVAPLPPLEPAEAPGGLVLVGRVKSPGKLLDAILESAAVPFDWRRALSESDAQAEMLLREAIDLDGPVEALMALNPRPQRKPYGVVSVSARGVPRVLRALDGLQVEAREGPGGIHYFTFDGNDCAVGRSLGKAPARVVCGDREESLRELLPYALRGFPAERLSNASAYFRVDAEPLRRAYGKQLRSLKLLASVAARQFHVDHPKFDRAMTETLTGLAAEIDALAQDLEVIEGQLLERKEAFEVKVKVGFSGNQSWTSGSVSELAGHADKAPETFSRLPATVTSASYARQLPKRRTREISEVLLALAGGYLEHQDVGAATVQRVERIVQSLLDDERPVVTATGPLVSEREDGRTRLAPSWSVWGTQRSQADVSKILQDVSAVLSSADLKNVTDGPAKLPTLSRKHQPLQGVVGAHLYEWAWPELQESLGGMPDPTMGAASSLRPRERGLIAVKEIEGVTWLAVAENPERLAEALGAVQAKPTALARDARLSALLEQKAVAAGFSTIEGLAGSLSPFFPERLARNWTSFLKSTPHGGESPMVYFVRAKGGETIELTATQIIPRELVVDLASLAVLVAVEK